MRLVGAANPPFRVRPAALFDRSRDGASFRSVSGNADDAEPPICTRASSASTGAHLRTHLLSTVTSVPSRPARLLTAQPRANPRGSNRQVDQISQPRRASAFQPARACCGCPSSSNALASVARFVVHSLATSDLNVSAASRAGPAALRKSCWSSRTRRRLTPGRQRCIRPSDLVQIAAALAHLLGRAFRIAASVSLQRQHHAQGPAMPARSARAASQPVDLCASFT